MPSDVVSLTLALASISCVKSSGTPFCAVMYSGPTFVSLRHLLTSALLSSSN